jgi:hypothetical protein
VDDFYAARSGTIPPLPWPNFAPPLIHKLRRFEEFLDYYEDKEVDVLYLPSLLQNVRVLRSQTGSTELQRFLDDLDALIAYAITQQKSLHAIAD